MNNAKIAERPPKSTAKPAPASDRFKIARYLAFAYCTADALLEMDPSGEIVFANGATQHLFGIAPPKLTGKQFSSLSEPGEQPLVKALLLRAAKGERFKDVRVSFRREGKPNILLSLNGYGVPDLKKHCFVTARVVDAGRDDSHDADRNKATGLLNAEAFGGSIKAHFEKTDSGVPKGEMTFVGMAGLTELEGRLNPAERKMLSNRLGTFLRAISMEGDSASQLSAEQFGLLHEAGLDIDSVKSQLSDFARDADPKGIGVSVSAESAGVDKLDVSGQDMAQALLYTIQQVAKEKNAGGPKVLSMNISDRLLKATEHLA
jgi:PAS domain S-box-containing protein